MTTRQTIAALHHGGAILRMVDTLSEPWMSEADKEEFTRELLAAANLTPQELDAQVQAGIDAGFDEAAQLALFLRVVKP